MHFYFTLQSTVMWCCQSNGSWCPKTQQGLEKHAAAFQCNAPQNRSEKSVEYLHSGGSAGGVWVQKMSQIYMILKLLMYIMNDVSIFFVTLNQFFVEGFFFNLPTQIFVSLIIMKKFNINISFWKCSTDVLDFNVIQIIISSFYQEKIPQII